MKILIDISPIAVSNLTGIGNYVFNLTKSQLELDFLNEYFLFCFCPIDQITRMRNHEFNQYKNVKKSIVIPLPSKISLKSFHLWQEIGWPSLETILRFRPDITLNHEWYTPSIRSTKLISTIFDLTTIKNPEWHKSQTVKMQKTRLKNIDKAKKIITISRFSKEDIQNKLSINEKKIEVLYPGVGEHIKIIDKKSNVLVLDKYNIRRNYILAVGTVEPRKNISRLIEAFNQVSNLIEEDLVIVGGNGWGEIPSLLQSSKIKFLGYVDNEELNVLYNGCHFFIYPSLYEGFGIPVLEALTLGKKVITSNSSSLPEVAGNTGLLVDPYSVDSIKNAIIEYSNSVINGKIYTESLTQASKFNYEDSAKKLFNLYHD